MRLFDIERLQITTCYIHDASGNLLAEADEYNNITRYYIYGHGLVAMVTPSDDLYCYHFNATGSTIALTDGSQEVVNKYAYTPFGIITNKAEAVPQPFKYVGQYGVMTEPNGFYYMRARYYDPQVGRFISEDPIGFGGGDLNLYVYVGNNPILLIDPYGNDWISSGLGFASYVLNTAGLVHAPAKFAGVAVSFLTIGYSGAQYKLGNMSAEEATRNIACAATDIAGVGAGALKPVAGIIVSGASRALGVSNTAIDAVMTATTPPTPSTPKPTQGTTTSAPTGKLF